MLEKMSHFKQRLIVGGLTAILFLVTIYLSPFPFFRPLFALICSVIIGAAVWEYYQIAKNKGFQPLDTLGIIFSIAYVLAIFLQTQTPYAHFIPEIVLLLGLASCFLSCFMRGPSPFANIAITFFPFVYLTIPLSCLILINYFYSPALSEDGRWWLVYLIAIAKMTDTGAYFSGKNWGRNKMAPFISPSKTWEGAIGGLAFGLLFSFVLYLMVNFMFEKPPITLSLFQSMWLGALISIVAQFGDLAESLLKRDGGIKDSNQLPGLGGVLDVVDSLVFAAPLLYIYLKIQ